MAGIQAENSRVLTDIFSSLAFGPLLPFSCCFLCVLFGEPAKSFLKRVLFCTTCTLRLLHVTLFLCNSIVNISLHIYTFVCTHHSQLFCLVISTEIGRLKSDWKSHSLLCQLYNSIIILYKL